MSQTVRIELEIPDELAELHLPQALQHRLYELLNRQDRGEALSPAEREEAEQLVNLSEFLTLLRMRSQRLGSCNRISL